jgi:hypothetical protein
MSVQFPAGPNPKIGGRTLHIVAHVGYRVESSRKSLERWGVRSLVVVRSHISLSPFPFHGQFECILKALGEYNNIRWTTVVRAQSL